MSRHFYNLCQTLPFPTLTRNTLIHKRVHVCQNVYMTTKNAVNVLLRAIGSDGLSGVKVHAHTLGAALDRLAPSDLPADVRARAITEIKRQALIETTHNGSVWEIQPSVKGIHRLQRAQVENVTIPRPSSWDGLWRMVTYDVPRANSAQRRLFARQLERLDFIMLRESVWFHPYPCFAAVEEIMSYCGLQRYVTLAEIGRIDNISLMKLRRAYPSL